MACGHAMTGLLFTPCDRHEYNFYLFLFLIGMTPIATDFWSDLDKQGDLCYLLFYTPNHSSIYIATIDHKHRQRLHMIQKQMMMIVSLVMVVVAVILASDEEELAQLRLPYHTSVLTGEGCVMELLAGHPQCIYTELRVSHEVFVALIDELCCMGHTDSKFVSLEEQVAIFLYTSVTGLTVQHSGEIFQQSNDTIAKYSNHFNILNIGAENYPGILKIWLLYFPHHHFTPTMSFYPLALSLSHPRYAIIPNSGPISRMQLGLLMAAIFSVHHQHTKGHFIEIKKGLFQ